MYNSRQVKNISQDIDQFDNALSQWFQFMKRPSTWTDITNKAQIKLNRPGAYILRILLLNKDSLLTVTKLANILGIEAPSVSREVTDLENMGLVKRIHLDKDKRNVYLSPTAKAEKINNLINKARQSISSSVLSRWPDRERKEFIKFFKKYVDEVTAGEN